MTPRMIRFVVGVKEHALRAMYLLLMLGCVFALTAVFSGISISFANWIAGCDLFRERNLVLGMIPLLLFAGSFFSAAYAVGSSGLDNLEWKIREWTAAQLPNLYRWQNNGVTAIVRKEDFDSTDHHPRYMRAVNDRITLRAVPNTMTFSDESRRQGTVTGTMQDLAELTKGCVVMHRGDILVPGTSNLATAVTPVSLKDAYEFVWGATAS